MSSKTVVPYVTSRSVDVPALLAGLMRERYIPLLSTNIFGVLANPVPSGVAAWIIDATESNFCTDVAELLQGSPMDKIIYLQSPGVRMPVLPNMYPIYVTDSTTSSEILSAVMFVLKKPGISPFDLYQCRTIWNYFLETGFVTGHYNRETACVDVRTMGNLCRDGNHLVFEPRKGVSVKPLVLPWFVVTRKNCYKVPFNYRFIEIDSL
jgi:hypothetical protein